MIRRIMPFALLTLSALPAQAASPIAEVLCQPTKDLRVKLETQFGATRSATGIRSPEQVMEVWTGQDGDWTLVVRYATGTSCIVAMGRIGSARPPGTPPERSDLETECFWVWRGLDSMCASAT